MRTPLFLAVVAGLLAARAEAEPSVVTDHARSRLVAEMDGVAPGGTLTLAFAQELQAGWHVYWKNPGDSGLPLEFKWKLPEGARAGPIDYPTPERIEIGPLVNFGHQGAPVFLTSIVAPKDALVGSTLGVRLKATWLICADICVPETGVFTLSVPVRAAPAAVTETAGLFTDARAAQPSTFDGDASYSVDREMIRLKIDGMDAPDEAYFFPATAGVSEPAARQKATRRGDSLVIDVKGGSALSSVPAPLEGVVVTNGVSRGLLIAAERRAEPASAALGGLLLAAFLGGALLNLMPCVLPILFVKAASMARAAAAGESGLMRRHGLLYGLGVVASFAALAGLLLALRAGGGALGWGFHLQSPIVVALSAYVLFAVGLNLAGAFSIGSGLQNAGARLLAGRGADLSSFLTGVLAVVVAAPCVGPFLTAPIGAAAVLPFLAAFSIFVAMAAGFAGPYVALSFWPGARRLLPKPGPWMERFRQALAFPVFAAAAYFVWVLSHQTSGRGLALALAGLVLLGLAARLWEWGRGARWGAVAAAAALAAAVVPVAMLKPAEAARQTRDDAVAFDPADIERRRASGEPVFVNFTAAWCVTCQINKLTVLSSPAVRAALAETGTVFVTADWTSRDRVIEGALASFGANGVPLYVYYPPGGEAVVLSQPLRERSLVAILRTGGDE